MEDTGEKRRKYGKYSDFLEDVWYNLWKIIKSYPLGIAVSGKWIIKYLSVS